MCTVCRKLDNILRELIPLEGRAKATRFLNSAEDVDRLSVLVEDIRGAVVDYQVRHQNFLPPHLISAPDVITARYLRQELSPHCESYHTDRLFVPVQ